MAYQKQEWEDYPSTKTEITAERLKHIEDGIYENSLNSDSLPINTVVEYDGETIPKGYEEVKEEVVVYDNPDGSNGDIDLSESLENAKRILIEFYWGDLSREYHGYQTAEFLEPNGKQISLDSIHKASPIVIQSLGAVYLVSNNRLIKQSQVMLNSSADAAGNAIDMNNALIKITKVIKYK